MPAMVIVAVAAVVPLQGMTPQDVVHQDVTPLAVLLAPIATSDLVVNLLAVVLHHVQEGERHMKHKNLPKGPLVGHCILRPITTMKSGCRYSS